MKRLPVCLLLIGISVSAHHFKGLPHFAYFENYPQVPQEEFIGRQGDYEASLVVYDFQGIDRSDVEQPNDVRLFLVIFNLRRNSVYAAAATIEIRDRERVVYTEHFEAADQESIYSLSETLPDDGRYNVVARLHGVDNLELQIPFTLSNQKVNWGKWVAATVILIIVTAAIGARRARVRLDRRANARQRRVEAT